MIRVKVRIAPKQPKIAFDIDRTKAIYRIYDTGSGTTGGFDDYTYKYTYHELLNTKPIHHIDWEKLDACSAISIQAEP